MVDYLLFYKFHRKNFCDAFILLGLKKKARELNLFT